MLWYRCISSPLGEITLYSDGTHLVGLRFRDGTDPERTADAEDRPLAVFDRTEEWLDLYFSGRIPPFAPPPKIDASPFRTAVYEALLEIRTDKPRRTRRSRECSSGAGNAPRVPRGRSETRSRATRSC